MWTLLHVFIHAHPFSLSLSPHDCRAPEHGQADGGSHTPQPRKRAYALAWIKLGCIIGGEGSSRTCSCHRNGHSTWRIASWLRRKQATYLGAQLLLAFFVLALGLRLFFRRRSLLSVKWLGSYTASFSPCVAIVGVLVTLLLTLFQALVHEVQYNSPDCMRLKLPLQEAPPPYLYISFHGSPDPLGGLCSGVGAVHRFSSRGRIRPRDRPARGVGACTSHDGDA